MIPRLEPTRQFVDRLVLLNRFHAPDQDDYDATRRVLAQVHKGFPEAPAHEQAAYLIAGLAVRQPFAEANFRTAWDYVCDVLAHRNLDFDASYRDGQDLGNRVWELTEAGEDPTQMLADWFRPRIHAGRQRDA